jgi:hypothetical protein
MKMHQRTASALGQEKGVLDMTPKATMKEKKKIHQKLKHFHFKRYH